MDIPGSYNGRRKQNGLNGSTGILAGQDVKSSKVIMLFDLSPWNPELHEMKLFSMFESKPIVQLRDI